MPRSRARRMVVVVMVQLLRVTPWCALRRCKSMSDCAQFVCMNANLDWDDLALVLALSRGAGLQQAADALGVHHSTAFRRLQRAEEHAGLALFHRRRRRVRAHRDRPGHRRARGSRGGRAAGRAARAREPGRRPAWARAADHGAFAGGVHPARAHAPQRAVPGADPRAGRHAGHARARAGRRRPGAAAHRRAAARAGGHAPLRDGLGHLPPQGRPPQGRAPAVRGPARGA
jgi:hypothetical protein